jgi:hypothetical protein
MVNRDIVTLIENKLSEGIGIQAICNLLVQSGYPQRDVDEAVYFIQNQKTIQQAASASGSSMQQQSQIGQIPNIPPAGNYPPYQPPFQKYDKYLDNLEDGKNMIAAYVVSAIFLIISAIAAMYFLKLF